MRVPGVNLRAIATTTPVGPNLEEIRARNNRAAPRCFVLALTDHGTACRRLRPGRGHKPNVTAFNRLTLIRNLALDDN